MGVKKRRDYAFPVECYYCKEVFDFGDYLTSDDSEKHIAEIVLEKCGGDNLICGKCKKEKRVLDSGTFQWVVNESEVIPKLELVSSSGKRKVLNVMQFDGNNIALVIDKNDFI